MNLGEKDTNSYIKLSEPMIYKKLENSIEILTGYIYINNEWKLLCKSSYLFGTVSIEGKKNVGTYYNGVSIMSNYETGIEINSYFGEDAGIDNSNISFYDYIIATSKTGNHIFIYNSGGENGLGVVTGIYKRNGDQYELSIPFSSNLNIELPDKSGTNNIQIDEKSISFIDDSTILAFISYQNSGYYYWYIAKLLFDDESSSFTCTEVIKTDISYSYSTSILDKKVYGNERWIYYYFGIYNGYPKSYCGILFNKNDEWEKGTIDDNLDDFSKNVSLGVCIFDFNGYGMRSRYNNSEFGTYDICYVNEETKSLDFIATIPEGYHPKTLNAGSAQCNFVMKYCYMHIILTDKGFIAMSMGHNSIANNNVYCYHFTIETKELEKYTMSGDIVEYLTDYSKNNLIGTANSRIDFSLDGKYAYINTYTSTDGGRILCFRLNINHSEKIINGILLSSIPTRNSTGKCYITAIPSINR